MAKKNDNLLLWVGLAIIAILVLYTTGFGSKFLITDNFVTEEGPVMVEVQYFKEGVEVTGLFGAYIEYDQVRFNIFATSEGSTLSGIELVDASPLIFKEALPTTSFATLEPFEKNKLIFTSDFVDAIALSNLPQPVDFWLEVSAPGSANEETTFSLTFTQPSESVFEDYTPNLISSQTNLAGGPENIFTYLGEGYLMGVTAQTSMDCQHYLDITIDGDTTTADFIETNLDFPDQLWTVNYNNILYFSESLALDLRRTTCGGIVSYEISYSTKDTCVPLTCGDSCSSEVGDGCGGIIDCSAPCAAAGNICDNGICKSFGFDIGVQ